ncbi:MAG: alpha/beta fold hydrolase [Cellvibrionaceae bacterium]
MSGSTSSRKGLIVPLDKKADAEEDVFLIAGLGGHVISLQLLAREFSDEVKAFGVLHPVFLGNEADTLEAVAEVMFNEIVQSDTKPPYYLAGFSMGGLIALEVARLMEANDLAVNVILVDTTMPILPPKKPLILRAHIHIRWHLERFFTRFTKGFYSDHKKKLVAINEDDNMKPKMPARFQKAYDLGRLAIKNYKITPCDVSVFLICSENIPWWDNLRYWPEDQGWGGYVNLKGRINCPGDHLDLLTHPECRKETGKAIVKSISILKSNP